MSPTADDHKPLQQLAMAYGVGTKGSDQLAGVSAAMQRELPAAAWDAMPEHLRKRRIVTRLLKDRSVSQVIGTMVVNIDGEGFESFKRGLPLDGRRRSSMEPMVEAAAFPDGGAPAFVDTVLDDMGRHLSAER